MVRVMFDNPTADSTARVLPLKSAALAFRLPTSSIYSVSLRNGWIQKKVTREYDFLSSLLGISLRSGLRSDAELKLAVSRTIRVFDALSMHNGRRLGVYLEVAA